jgi:hypothetical protein
MPSANVLTGWRISHNWLNSKSKLCYDRRSVGQSVLVSNTHPGSKTRLLLLLDSFGFVDVGRPLWRGRVCRLQFLLALTSVVILGSESLGAHDHILVSQIRDSPPTWRTRSPCLYPLGTGWPSYTPRHWVPVSSPRTTRRTTVEVFEPASSRGL